MPGWRALQSCVTRGTLALPLSLGHPAALGLSTDVLGVVPTRDRRRCIARRRRCSGASSTLASLTNLFLVVRCETTPTVADGCSLAMAKRSSRLRSLTFGAIGRQLGQSPIHRPEHQATTPESAPVRSIPLGPSRAAATTPRVTVRQFSRRRHDRQHHRCAHADIAGGVVCRPPNPSMRPAITLSVSDDHATACVIAFAHAFWPDRPMSFGEHCQIVLICVATCVGVAGFQRGDQRRCLW